MNKAPLKGMKDFLPEEMRVRDYVQGKILACVDGIFGERIRFLGIQGSYGRGEATAESDIDVVLLLDGLQLEDLQTYDEAVSALPMREKLCGFVGGWEELIHWDKADLFQFIQDTRALRGSLDDLWREITKKDIQRAVHKGACDLYHGCELL